MITNITIGKLPYQPHPFVHGVSDGKDVWLKNDGTWTDVDGDPECSIPFSGLLWLNDGPNPDPKPKPSLGELREPKS